MTTVKVCIKEQRKTQDFVAKVDIKLTKAQFEALRLTLGQKINGQKCKIKYSISKLKKKKTNLKIYYILQQIGKIVSHNYTRNGYTTVFQRYVYF